jgi:hypothetical protein
VTCSTLDQQTCRPQYFALNMAILDTRLGQVSLCLRGPVKRLEFVSDSLSYTLVRAPWCDITIHIHASTEGESNGRRTAAMRNYSMCSTNRSATWIFC